ncbi:MAG: site-specific DNA-methyltransferase [Xanthobacteraceae bacterium]
MRVEYIGNATLYNGDCLDVIPTLSGISAVVTDPPYGIEDLVGGYGRSGETIANDRNLDVCMAALQIATGVAPEAIWAVFYSPRIRREFFDSFPPALHDLGEIIWDKKAPGMGRGIRYQHETIALFYTGEPKKLVGDTFSVLRDYRSAETHPHQKPLSLIKTLCEIAGGDVVLDPFMGSGTTGVACAALGKRFIGIEIDPKHFETSCARIRAAHAAPGLFGAAPAPVQVIDMFPVNDNTKRVAACA